MWNLPNVYVYVVTRLGVLYLYYLSKHMICLAPVKSIIILNICHSKSNVGVEYWDFGATNILFFIFILFHEPISKNDLEISHV